MTALRIYTRHCDFNSGIQVTFELIEVGGPDPAPPGQLRHRFGQAERDKKLEKGIKNDDQLTKMTHYKCASGAARCQTPRNMFYRDAIRLAPPQACTVHRPGRRGDLQRITRFAQ